MKQKVKVALLFLGDVAALYISLGFALALRYGSAWQSELVENHIAPFSIIFILWILVFYIAGLYDLPRLRNNIDFIKNLSLTLFVNALLTTTLFYLIPYFGIAPKTNLFLFIAIFAALESWWRRTFNIRASFREGLNRVLILDGSPRAEEIVEELSSNPQIGYAVKAWLKEGIGEAPIERLPELVKDNSVNLVVVPHHAKENRDVSKAFYELLASGVEIIDLPTFYESVFRKVPLSEIREEWFLEHHIGQKQFYDDLKRGMELILSLVLLVLLSPLLFLIALLVQLTSAGPAIYTQTRIGKNGRPFTLYKFRSMRKDAEKNGAQWAEARDPRSTPIGSVLRYSHLDELPQLANILKNDLSFVGPRPERPEFVRVLKEKIPYYEIRLLAKPGVTGWAQINYRKDQTDDDVKEKLQHDLYYLKNRSIILDIAIVLKTLKSFFVNQ